MAFGAAIDVERVISRKGASAVVALEAIIPGSRKMLADGDIGDLLRLRPARSNVVTLITAYALPLRVVAVTENVTETVFRLERPVIRRECVTCRARADLGLGRVTRKAIRVCIDSRLYSLSRPRGEVTR